MASLKGIRVLEMAQIMAGPTCGLLLADLGAEAVSYTHLRAHETV